MAAQIRLISLSDFNDETVDLATSIEEKRINPSIDTMQNTDLKKVLGAALYSDLLLNFSEPNYEKLLNGDTYIDTEGNTIVFAGLRFALIYWTLTYFANTNQITFTSHGIVQKLDPRSEPVEPKLISQTVANFRAIAGSYWNDSEKYLNDNKSSFPLWGKTPTEVNRGPVKINVVGGDMYDDDRNNYSPYHKK